MLTKIFHLHLTQAGVKDIILAVNYRPEVMVSILQKYEKLYDVTITFSVETEPLGTGMIEYRINMYMI